MAVRPIVLYPNPILKTVCREADWQDSRTQEVAQDLVDTLKAGPGVGVAAPQIGVDLRLFVVDVTPKNPGHGLLVLLNPRLLVGQGEHIGREGCLSIPAYTANVRRHATVTLEACNLAGEKLTLECEGFEAICIQHELDHLDGILFLDRVSCLKTEVFRRKGVKPTFEPQDHQQGVSP